MTSTALAYILIAAGAVTVYRLLTSRSGSISFGRFRATWGR